MIVSPPRMIGTASVARLFGITAHAVRRRLVASPEIRVGYLGKIANQHTWNAPVLIASMFGGDVEIERVVDALTNPTPADALDRVLCAAPDCDQVEQAIGLCPRHLYRLTHAWRRAPRSSLVTMQLVAMCRWVVERNAHLVLPDDFDPWSGACMTPGCTRPTNGNGWYGPLCRVCSALFWQNAPRRPWPSHWKPTREARHATEEQAAATA